MFSVCDRVSSCHQPEDIDPHQYDYMEMDSRSPEKNEVKLEEGRDYRRQTMDRCGRFLNMEVALKCVELVLLIICIILLSQVKYDFSYETQFKLYPNIIFSTFINLTIFRMVSIAFHWPVSKKLILCMNCSAAILIGGSSGVTFCIWYFEPNLGKNSGSIEADFLFAETLMALFTACVYLMDIGHNVNTLKSLSF